MRSHVSLSLPLPLSPFHSLTLFWLRLPAEKGNCNYSEGVARRKQLKGRQAASSGHKLFVVLWLPSCLAGKYIACGWCASRIYVAPAPFVQHMGAYCFKYNCFKFFISYKNLRPTGPRGVKCLGFQHSIKREFIWIHLQCVWVNNSLVVDWLTTQRSTLTKSPKLRA